MIERNGEINESATTTEASFQPSQVAPLLPQTAPMPELPRRVFFLTGLLLFWLLPYRYGPHLAVMSFRRALAAYVMSVAFAAWISAVAWIMANQGSSASAFYELRSFAANVVVGLAAESASGGWITHPITLLVILFIVPQIVLAVLGIILMPWCAGGDRAWSVFKRSLKNVYWTTTLLMPLSLAVVVVSRASQDVPSWVQWSTRLHVLVLLVFITLAILVLRALFTGAGRYVGKPDGPAFHPREPLCDECGYRIVGLPLISDCPECGTPVRDSLPGGRRRPKAWQQASGFAKLGALFRMQWRVLRGDRIFKEIQVHSGLATDRRFWFATLLLILLSSLSLLRIWLFLMSDKNDFEPLVWTAIFIIGIGLIVQPLMMFIGAVIGQVKFGIRDYRASAAACYYATPLMWPLILIMLVMSGFVLTPPGKEFLDMKGFPLINPRVDGHEVLVMVWAVLSMAALIYWFSRMLGALKKVRYANV